MAAYSGSTPLANATCMCVLLPPEAAPARATFRAAVLTVFLATMNMPICRTAISMGTNTMKATM